MLLWAGFRSENKPHPYSYMPEDITVATIRRLRGGEGCYPAAALRYAALAAIMPLADSFSIPLRAPIALP